MHQRLPTDTWATRRNVVINLLVSESDDSCWVVCRVQDSFGPMHDIVSERVDRRDPGPELAELLAYIGDEIKNMVATSDYWGGAYAPRADLQRSLDLGTAT
jgi:hypothetical protein